MKFKIVSISLALSAFYCAAAAAAQPKAVCIGDNDVKASSCFNGLSRNTSRPKDWQYVMGGAFYNNSAWVTKTVTYNYAAQWVFTTPVKGDVWLSVWIPSSNATARNVLYQVYCKSETGGAWGGPNFSSTTKFIDQLNYSAQWVTIGNLGEFPKGASCRVEATKYYTKAELNSGGIISETKMAIDGMKMTIY